MEDMGTSAVIAVTAATVDGTNPKKVNLTTGSLSYGHKYKITAINVKSTGGSTIGATNSATVQVRFRLVDPNNIVGTQGIDPGTGQPGQITVTGSSNNWAANATER